MFQELRECEAPGRERAHLMEEEAEVQRGKEAVGLAGPRAWVFGSQLRVLHVAAHRCSSPTAQEAGILPTWTASPSPPT